MALMAIVNLVSICMLGKWAFAAIKDYHRQAMQGEEPVFIASLANLPGVLDGDIWEIPEDDRHLGELPESVPVRPAGRVRRAAVRLPRLSRAA